VRAVVGLDGATPETDVAALVDSVKSAPERRDELVALLPEKHPLYAGRGANTAMRLRGYILAAFESAGLPEAALAYVLDELQNGRDAYVTAAAASALRGLTRPATSAATVVACLERAIDNIRYLDDAVSFATYRPSWPLKERTSALEEIFRSFTWLGPAAQPALSRLEALQAEGNVSPGARAALAEAIEAIRGATLDRCCDGLDDCRCGQSAECCEETFLEEIRLAGPAPTIMVRQAQPPTAIELEDQAGRHLTYADFFSRSPAIVVFFYTRCDNPNKCSLSIAKLARLQAAIAARGLGGQLKTAAITYDPGFDIPQRLKAYGEIRAFNFDDDNRFFRTNSEFDILRAYFDLGVNYGDVLVNRHRIELFVVDSRGKLVDSFTRLQWEPDEVLARAASLLEAGPSPLDKTSPSPRG
jgi:protein SCO1/2